MRVALAVLLLLCSALASAQPAQESAEPPRVSLLTFAPGEVYWQRFGHNALLLRDAHGEHVYNYGIFDFHQRNFFLNFARGRMLYRLAEEPLMRTLRQYAAEGRWVHEQELALDPAQRRAVGEYLRWNLRPENVDYRYDYFRANCSTRVRDVIDLALGGALRAAMQARDAGTSYRVEALRMMAPVPPLMIGMDLLLGPRADAPIDVWAQSFLPVELMQAVREMRVANPDGSTRALVAGEMRLLASDRAETPWPASSLALPFLFTGIAGAALLLGLARIRRHRFARILFRVIATLLVLLLGLAGSVLLAGWLLTEHWAMARNLDLLLVNPLVLLLLGACATAWSARAPSHMVKTLLALNVVTPAITLVLALTSVQSNLHWVLLLAPLHAALAFCLTRERLH